MKCPKCGYLGFESVERCRNCGYDFSLLNAVVTPELPMRTGDEADGYADLALLPEDAASAFASEASNDGHSSARSSELPLFVGPAGSVRSRDDDEAPLIAAASTPRPPLAVRRSTPELPRLRPERPRAQTLDLALDDMPLPADSKKSGPEAAGIAARFGAVVIDLAVLMLVDLVVIYFTMEICGLTIADLSVLPKGPLLAFLLVQNGGYLVAFTAGGQTLGKMATGIRVVTDDSGSSLDLGHASMRTLVWLLLIVPAGLGLLTAVFSPDRRGLHDRCAGSRVIRASA